MLRSARLSSPMVLVVTSALVAGHAARADDASAPTQAGVATLQEVVVTAQKRRENLQDVPMAVSAITSADLQSMHLVNFADLETQVPGLSVELLAPGFDKLTLRGENVGSVGSTVATYLDDVPFGSSSALANGGSLTGDFDTWDLQRVEVLRGPQGTLYGSSSEGGLLKYVTNPPQLNRFAGALEVGDEDVAHGDTAPSYKAMLNLPVGSVAALRLDGYYSRMPGYINDPQLGESDINRGYRAGGRASFLLDVSDDFSVRLSAFSQTMHTDDTPSVDVIGAAGSPLTPPADQLQPDDGNYGQHRYISEPATLRYDIYSGTINWNLGWSTLTAVTGYETIDQDEFGDETSLALGPGLTLGDLVSSLLPPGTIAGASETSDVAIRKLTQEVRLASPTGTALEWQVGAFFTHESSELPQTVPSFIIPTQAPTGLPVLEYGALNGIYREWAAFAQVTYHFNPAFDLELGGRWSENKQSEYTTSGGLLLGPPTPETADSTGTDFTYSVAPRWHLSRNTMAYARVATGYRPGGPNQVPPYFPANVARSYKSDSTVNYELGIKSTMLDNRLTVDLAAYLINWKDIQLSDIVDNFGISANGGTATSRGLEWNVALRPVRGLSLALTGSYIDAYLTADAPATGGVTGDGLPYVPKWSNSLDAAYTWNAFADYSAFAGATWSYIGSQFNDFSASPEPVGNLVVYMPNPRVRLGGYNTINLRAGLENERWTFELYCRNLADSRGLTYYIDQGTPNFGGSVTIQQPRTIGLTIDLRL
jgi:iron complex outermembrane recepter protein